MPIPPRPGGVEIAAIVSVLLLSNLSCAVVSVEALQLLIRRPNTGSIRQLKDQRMKRTTIIISTNWVEILSAAQSDGLRPPSIPKASST